MTNFNYSFIFLIFGSSGNIFAGYVDSSNLLKSALMASLSVP